MGVKLGVEVGVLVDVGSGVSVSVAVGVEVAVAVGVSVGVEVGMSVGVGVAVAVSVGIGVSVGVNVGVFVGTGVAVSVAVDVGKGVAVAVGAPGTVVKLLVELVAMLLPSLTVAYHSYWVSTVKPDQLTVAFEPEGTTVVPISVNGAEFPCIVYARVNWLSASVSNVPSQGE